jgi:hypothetical protein
MAAGRTYQVTITPNGPKGSSCTVLDQFDQAFNPVPVIHATMTYMSVAVDGSDSYDPDPDGSIVSYAWNFGDGAVAVGATAEHAYETPGDYSITLVLEDNEGLEGTGVELVTAAMPPPPVADFSAAVSGMLVTVDASASSAAVGIASYTWTWGDGSAPEVMTTPTASHTYVQDGGLAVLPASAIGTDSVVINAGIPPQPYTCWGYVTDTGGSPVLAASVTITDITTGTMWTGTTDMEYGYYSVDLNMYWESPEGVGWAEGDVIQVDVTKGAGTGTAQGIALGLGNEAFMKLDIVMIGGEPVAHEFTITLTVTDTYGQSTSVSEIVTLYW